MTTIGLPDYPQYGHRQDPETLGFTVKDIKDFSHAGFESVKDDYVDEYLDYDSALEELFLIGPRLNYLLDSIQAQKEYSRLKRVRALAPGFEEVRNRLYLEEK